MRNKTLVIAEIGINHSGDLKTALEMVSAAKAAGADVVKFHTYNSDSIMIPETPLADYMTERSDNCLQPNAAFGSFYELARSYELTGQHLRELKRFAESLDIEFMSSPFDVESVGLLKSIGVNRLKIPSGEITNPFLLKAVAKTHLPLILSTGMSTLEEIQWAINLLREHQCGPITVLHCLSQYPAEFIHLNLNSIQTLRTKLGLPLGFSDHTIGYEASIAATALGATIIEKHFTLDRSLPGPDHKASLLPEEFAEMVVSIRNIEVALGDGVKNPKTPELCNKKIVRKSLVLKTPQYRGTVLTEAMLTAKRPESGIPANRLFNVIGKRLTQDVSENIPLKTTFIE